MTPDSKTRPGPIDDDLATRLILDLDRLFEWIVTAVAAEAVR